MDASLLFSGRHGVPTVSGLGCSGAAIGYWQKIDVNAFEIETYWYDVACCFASDELYLVCAVA